MASKQGPESLDLLDNPLRKYVPDGYSSIEEAEAAGLTFDNRRGWRMPQSEKQTYKRLEEECEALTPAVLSTKSNEQLLALAADYNMQVHLDAEGELPAVSASTPRPLLLQIVKQRIDLFRKASKAKRKGNRAVRSQMCGHCGKMSAKLLKCSRCQCVYYCGAACQRAAWKVSNQHYRPTSLP